ncbi:MAG: tRNA(Ile)-lysidine synthetase, partial [Novosphingobium sp. 16-62-11]
RGLAGMRSRAKVPGCADLSLLRPMLDWRRADLLAVVEAAGLTAADDPSNRDSTFERVRIRAALSSSDAFITNGFADSARHLAQADGALEWAVDNIWQDVQQTAEGFTWNPPPGLPQVIAMRVLERILAAFGRCFPRGPSLVRWLATLQEGGVATLGGIKGDGRRTPWRFTRTPERNDKG